MPIPPISALRPDRRSVLKAEEHSGAGQEAEFIPREVAGMAQQEVSLGAMGVMGLSIPYLLSGV